MSPPEHRRGRARGWAGLGGLVALAGLCVSSIASSTSLPPADRADCTDAIVVDGRLSCAARLDPLTRGVCPDLGPIPAGSRIDAQRCSVTADPQLMTALALPVDVNAASVDALQTLPGIGPVLAGRIAQARPFPSLAALQAVSGIGPATVRRISERARVGPSRRESSHSEVAWPNSGPGVD